MRRFIAEAIDSVLNQTYSNIEIIVVDDGSTDGTGEFLRERYHDKIHYVYQQNQGRGASRNYGLRLAQGEYIQFLDADDLIYPEKLETQVLFLRKHPEYAAAYGHCLFAYEDDMEHPLPWGGQSYYVSGDILKQEIHNPFLVPVMILVRRQWVKRVGGFDETLPSNEDWDLWLHIAQAGGRFFYVSGEIIGLYRWSRQRRGNSATHLESGVRVLRKLQRSLNVCAQRRLNIQSAIGHWLFSYGMALAEDGEVIKGILTMLKGIILDPRNLDAKLARIGLCFLPLKPMQREALFQFSRRLKQGT